MRWENTHKISKQWVNCINELVECWSQLEGKIEEQLQGKAGAGGGHEQNLQVKALWKKEITGSSERKKNDHAPVDEMRKLSQMVANQPEEYPDVPAEEDKKEAGEEAKEGEKTDGDVSVSATIKLAPPAETPEAAAEPAPES